MVRNRLRFILKIKNSLLYLFAFSLTLTLSCTVGVKKDEGGNFERQASEISTDEMLIGDDQDFYGADTPKGAIFFLKARTDFLRGFAVKPLRFNENDKTVQELATQLNTAPIYQIELYEMAPPEKSSPERPDICNYVSENSAKAQIIFGATGLSFRVRERNWIVINKKVDPDALVFVRLGIGEPFSIIKNNAADGLWINAKKNDKDWESFSSFDKKKIIAWTCQETSFMETRSYEALYYNPDIVFQYD